METSSLADDDDEAEMNSSCAAVSEILLSLEDASPPSSRLQSPARRCDSLDRQSTVRSEDFAGARLSTADGATVTCTDDVWLSSRSVPAGRPVADKTSRIDETSDDGDRARCAGPIFDDGRGRRHSTASLTLSADDSPSLMNTTRLVHAMSTGGSSVEATTCSNTTAAAAVPADVQVPGVDGRVMADVAAGVSSVLAAAFSVSESSLPSQSSLDADDDIQPRASSSSTRHPAVDESSHHHSDCSVEMSDDSSRSSSTDTPCTSLHTTTEKVISEF